MLLTITAPGSHGDFQPHIALGKGFVEAGLGFKIRSEDGDSRAVDIIDTINISGSTISLKYS